MNTAHEKILQRLNEFACRRCNACCEQPGFVYLKEGEAEAMARFLRMELYAFTEQFAEVLERRRLVLKKKSSGEACVFLTAEGCGVYPVRPAQCRDFPRGWRTQRSFDYCEGLRALEK